ncbi:MAG: hypothetical protein ACXWID_05215 [Pyrinomonadaceae bacterium]
MSNIKRQLQRLQGVVPFAALVIPAAFIGILILKYSVNLPQWDEWVIVNFLHKLNAGTLSLSDLFRQQNEYRQFFPNLIFVIIGRLTKLDVRYYMGVSLLLACLISFNIYRLGKVTLERTSDRLWAYVAANLLIFSPVQHENWLQGQQLIYFFPIACLSSCLVIATAPRLRTATKFTACGALSIISTFSSVNGILCWLLVLPVLAWSPGESRPKNRWLVAWLVGFLLCAVAYLYDYHQIREHPSPLHMFAHPVTGALYFLNLIGRPLGAVVRSGATLFQKAPPAVIGFAVVALFTWACVQFKRSLADPVDAQRRFVWLIMGAYSLLTALLITVGRAGFGVGQSLTSRYTTFTLYVVIALVYLWTIAMRKKTRERGFVRSRILRRVPVAAVVIILIHLPIYFLAVRSASRTWRISLQAKACALMINAVDDPCLKDKVYPDLRWFRDVANTADRLGLLHPPLVNSDRAQNIADSDVIPSSTNNSFEEVTQVGTYAYSASGRAISPRTGNPPDAVLLAYDQGHGQDIIFAMAFPKTDRRLMSFMLRRDLDTSWQRNFDTRKLPAGRLRLTAWGFDAESGKAYRLAGEHTVQNADSLDVR